MPTIYDQQMPQAALYWPPGVADGYGGYADGSPASVRVRWEDKSVLFIDPNGEERRSSSVVYVNQEVIGGGHMTLSALDAAAATEDDLTRARAGAREIIAVNKSPSISGDVEIVKAFL